MQVKETTTFIVTKGISLLIENGQLRLVTSSIGEQLTRADAKSLAAALSRAASLIKVPRVRKPRQIIITGEGE